MRLALALALAKAGRSIAARMAMMAMTTRSSMRVKARRHERALFRPLRPKGDGKRKVGRAVPSAPRQSGMHPDAAINGPSTGALGTARPTLNRPKCFRVLMGHRNVRLTG